MGPEGVGELVGVCQDPHRVADKSPWTTNGLVEPGEPARRAGGSPGRTHLPLRRVRRPCRKSSNPAGAQSEVAGQVAFSRCLFALRRSPRAT